MTTLSINGQSHETDAAPDTPLLWVIRDHLGMTGTKFGCGMGLCGACTVHLDGVATRSCHLTLKDAQGKAITTIEGFAMSGDKPHPVVQAFVNNDAQQCGYCTPGFVVASKAFLDRNPNPTYDQVKDGLGGNLCRCGTYVGIRKAVLEAAKVVKGGPRA